MTPDLDKKLCDKYPKIFAQRHLPMTHTAMCWGIETGDGWYNIIDMMCAAITNHVKQQRELRARRLVYKRALKRAVKGDKTSLINYYAGKGGISKYGMERVEKDILEELAGIVNPVYNVPEKINYPQAVQVKEKFGTLRFYTDISDEYIDGVIQMAEYMSAVTCETCGNLGKLRGVGWLYTACDEHAQVQDKD